MKWEEIEPSPKSIDEILEMENDDEAVGQLSRILWKKAHLEEEFESLNCFEKNVMYVDILLRYIVEYGLLEYLEWHHGKYAHETLDALLEINAHHEAKILSQAIDLFPKLPIPKADEIREALVQFT